MKNLTQKEQLKALNLLTDLIGYMSMPNPFTDPKVLSIFEELYSIVKGVELKSPITLSKKETT